VTQHTLSEVLDDFSFAEGVRPALESALLAREDEMADELRMAGMNLGAMPELVAEAIAEIGIGTPPAPEMRELIHQQFHARMEWLQEQFRQQGGDGG